MHTIHSDKRKSGISLIGDLPWGSHFCQFYQTKKDLLDILVPYFKAGLMNNELCVWVTSRSLGADDVKKALKKAVPHFERYAKNGQMEIIPYTRCHVKGKKPGRVLVSMLDRAVSNGFDGLRLACSASPAKEGVKSFTCYGADAISKHNAIAVFAYPRDRFDAIGLMEVVKNHRFALLKNTGKWEVLESSEARTLKDALKKSEERYRGLFENMIEGFAYCRMIFENGEPHDFIYLSVNHAFETLTGLKDVVGKRVTEVIPGIREADPELIEIYGRVSLTGKSERFEMFVAALKMWFSISVYSPEKEHFVAVFDVITERKRYEENLIRSKQEWERTFDSVPDLIALIDNHHRILRVNKAMAQKLGLDAEQCVGLPCYEYVHGLSGPPAFCPHSHTLKDCKQHIEEVHEPRLGGHFLVSTTPMFDEQGQLAGSVHVARDITERKQAEEERERLLEELKRSNKELEQFAYIASHDLQEPLRMVSSYVQLISHRYKDRLDKDADEFIGYAVNGTAHMQTLLNDLLTYSRAGAPGKPFALTDLNSVLSTTAVNLKKLIDDNHAEITHESLPAVYADKVQMVQVFQNLIGNAIKFRSNEPPHVKISIDLENNEWVVRVSDNGIGIDPKYFNRIFHIFKRIHSRDKYDGTGIGLAICRKIVERHGGRIWVDSEPGKGSTFYFTIPAASNSV
jgi:PAS domain S-box-containing protein